MKKSDFRPFENEADSLLIGEDLTIENRLDRVSLFGSIDLTLDREGLRAAKELKGLLDQILSQMEKRDLPDRVVVLEPEIVENPFA